MAISIVTRAACCKIEEFSRVRQCVHHLEMSLFLPFRNVTPRRLGSDGGRARSPSVAQRPTGGRLVGVGSRTRFYRASARSLGS